MYAPYVVFVITLTDGGRTAGAASTPADEDKVPATVPGFSWHNLLDLDFMIIRVLEAYRELENLARPRAALDQDKNCQSEKERAWYAAYESFMHHAKYTLRFVKKIPGQWNFYFQIVLLLINQNEMMIPNHLQEKINDAYQCK